MSSAWGDVATGAFCGAFVAAVIAVGLLSRALFPRHREAQASLFYFGLAASFRTPEEYAKADGTMSEADLEANIASQAWRLAVIAREKFRYTRHAYYALLSFFALWSIARIALSIAK